MQPSKTQIIIGRVLSGLAIAFLLFDGIMKFFLDKLPPEAMADAAKLAFPMELMTTIGTILIICTILYAIPRTALWGAVLLTGYLGGAVSIHVRVGNPLATHTLFPIYIALLIWFGLCLRNSRLRDIFLKG